MIQLPLFETPSSWAPPSHLPDLSHAKEIAIDTECRDPHLKERGPGYIRRDGYVVGFGVATDTGFRGYYPVAHATGGNLDPTLVRNWLRQQCSHPDVDYVFANAQYDLGWLRASGVEVKGRINDICIADTLIDEERPDGYSLEALAKRWLGQSKDETLLREAAKNWSLKNVKADLWKLPANLVGPYGEADPVQTLAVWQKQKPVLRSMGLWPVYKLESRLIPILFEMFWRGIRVDTKYAEELNAKWLKREREILNEFNGLDIWSTAHLACLCKSLGVNIPRTAPTKNFPTGQDSVTSGFMESVDHPVLNRVREARAINRTREVYLEQNLIKNVINGRIHPQYVQMHCDEGGTRTMRLSCKNPNAQQFPKRSTLFDAKSIRKCLLPEEGLLWCKQDYWSQEPVIQCHYGLLEKLPGAEEVREQFKKGVKLYTYIEQRTHGRLSYDKAKVVGLARTYGMGKTRMSRKRGNTHRGMRSPAQRFRFDRSLCRPPGDERRLQSPGSGVHPHDCGAPAPLQLMAA